MLDPLRLGLPEGQTMIKYAQTRKMIFKTKMLLLQLLLRHMDGYIYGRRYIKLETEFFTLTLIL